MKLWILIATVVLGCCVPAVAQQRPESHVVYTQKADSQQVNKNCQLINRMFTLSSDQKLTLFTAQLQIEQQKRFVFSQYWKTPEFSIQLAAVNRSRDSLFNAILGEKQYRMYKDSVWLLRAKGSKPDSTTLQKRKL